MKVYIIDYPGLWLGGEAVVIAESPAQALQLVEEHHQTINFEFEGDDEASIREVIPLHRPRVLFNKNGDY